MNENKEEIIQEMETTNLDSIGQKKKITLKQKEEIAKAAYKSWFRIKPGHKQIKDQWWALYYRKVLPEYHCRDNHLGRKVNQWIEEDLKALGIENKHEVDEEEAAVPPIKKKKPNSSKEGTMPAYMNVELIHPPPVTVNDLENANHVILATHCVNGDIDWTTDSIEEDIIWFRENRQKLMDAIPLVSGKPRSPDKKNKVTPKKTKLDEFQGQFVANPSWVKADLFRSRDAYVLKVDLPGVSPTNDFSVQTNDLNKVAIKGERKNDSDNQNLKQTVLSSQRPHGPFSIDVVLPNNVDLSKTEQTFQHGVLTVKCPFKPSQWRNLGEDLVELSEEM